jgi:outer membrane protein
MNRTHARIALALAVALSLTAFAQTGRAASSPASPASPAAPAVAPTKIGIVNMQMAILASNEGQRDFEALQKRFDPKNVELKNRNDEIDNLKKQLQTQGDKMNEEARANLVRQIEAKQTALKRFVEDTQGEIRTQQSDLGNSIGAKLYKTLSKYATDHGYAVVIDVSNEQNTNVLWAANGVNITQAIVDAYNTESGVPAPPKPAAGAPSAPSATRPAPKPATQPTTTTPPKPR